MTEGPRKRNSDIGRPISMQHLVLRLSPRFPMQLEAATCHSRKHAAVSVIGSALVVIC
jgi:hypothetical protein